MRNRTWMPLAMSLVVITSACSQTAGPGGYEPGPGMMGGYGPGPGMMGGYGGGYGPGMMGGYGPGMMGGYGGGYGPGMMGGYGPGMMGGYGPGMMGGYGGGYGPGGWALNIPGLTDDQRNKIAEIQKEFREKQWALMGKLREEAQSGNFYRGGKFDEQAARKAYDARQSVRKQMFDNSIEAQKRIDSVLTPQQREQLQRVPGGR